MCLIHSFDDNYLFLSSKMKRIFISTSDNICSIRWTSLSVAENSYCIRIRFVICCKLQRIPNTGQRSSYGTQTQTAFILFHSLFIFFAMRFNISKHSKVNERHSAFPLQKSVAIFKKTVFLKCRITMPNKHSLRTKSKWNYFVSNSEKRPFRCSVCGEHWAWVHYCNMQCCFENSENSMKWKELIEMLLNQQTEN